VFSSGEAARVGKGGVRRARPSDNQLRLRAAATIPAFVRMTSVLARKEEDP